MGGQIIDLKRSTSLFAGLPTEFIVIGVDTPHKSRQEHPLWDERAFDRPSEEDIEFAATQELKDGVSALPPIQVRPEGENKAPTIVDGRGRRFSLLLGNERRVAKGLKPLVLRAEAVSLDDADALFYMISRNEHSRPDSIEIKARKAVDLLAAVVMKRDKTATRDNFNDKVTTPDLKAVALAFKATESAVRNWCLLTTLPEHLQEAVSQGVASPSTAIALSRKPVEEQKRILGQAAPAASVEAKADENQEPAPAPTPRKAKAKVSKTVVAGGARGKKFFKRLIEDWGESLPADLVLGVKIAASLVEDKDVPASVRHYIQATQWDMGEVDFETLPRVVQAMLRKKTRAQE